MSINVDVSIIIVSWNTRDILRDCLNSVYAQTEKVDFEIIIIDNASSDGSVEMVRQEFPKVTLIANKNNRGFASANNQGMNVAHGRYTLLLNSDTIVLDGAIEKTVLHADQEPDVGVIGCQALWPDGKRQNTCFRFPTLKLVMLGAFLFFREAKPFQRAFLHPDRYLNRDFGQTNDVDVVAGCYFLVRREVIEQVGVFDEDFFMYGEEAEWCQRAAKRGWRIQYFPGAKIIHIYGASSSQVEEDTKVNKRKGNLLFLHKTRGAFVAWLGNVIMVFGMLLRIPFWVIEDVGRLIIRKEGNKIWGNRIKVIRLHLAGLFFPVWKP